MTLTVAIIKESSSEKENVKISRDRCEEDESLCDVPNSKKDVDASAEKSKFKIYRESLVLVPRHSKADITEICKEVCIESSNDKTTDVKADITEETSSCPFLPNGQFHFNGHVAWQPKSNEQPSETRQNENLQRRLSPEVNSPLAVIPSPALTPPNSPKATGPDSPPSGSVFAASVRCPVAPLWSRARHLAATREDSPPGVEDATCADDLTPESWWAPAPIDEHRRSRLFSALRGAGRRRSGSADRAVAEAVGSVLYRTHPELRVQRFCQPPTSRCGHITAEEFLLRAARPVHVHGDLFLAPATLTRDQLVAMIRTGQYHRGHGVACFYAFLYSYEFVFFCEYLRHVKCHTVEAHAVLRGVLQRAQNLHLITHSATLFSLAPEAMFSQRSPFLYLARLFPMQEPWEADLLCDMINSRDIVKEATAAWKREQHALFTIHRDMSEQSRLQGRRQPPFHPSVTRPACSAAAFSNIEGEQVQQLDSHGLVVFRESGASYAHMAARCRFAPLGQLSAEDVLRRAVGRHALVRLFDDVFFVGAPAVDLGRAQVRYLRPAEVRLHVQLGFYFESPEYVSFLWSAQQGVGRALREACLMHSPQLSTEETALVRWLMHEFTDFSRRGVQRGARQMARFGPYLLNEYGKTLWRVLGEERFEGTLRLCTDLSEHVRCTLEAALAQHNCLAGE